MQERPSFGGSDVWTETVGRHRAIVELDLPRFPGGTFRTWGARRACVAAVGPCGALHEERTTPASPIEVEGPYSLIGTPVRS